MQPDVLVVGAGPTGLALALWLVRMGVRVRIVDKAPRSGTTSRALVVHARTLELYEQLDLANAVVEAGTQTRAVNLWARGHHTAHLELVAGAELSRYPFFLIYPQDRHEALLEARLAEAGVRVERGVEVVELAGTTATLQSGARISARFVAGCDGARSVVRTALGAEFAGATYSHVYYVADVTARGPTVNGELHVAFDEADFLARFPIDGATRVRLIGEIEHASDFLTWNDVAHAMIERLKIDVEQVHWFSSYRVHHRVASTYDDGTRFLLGDAAHIHSPVGGQGMNTGIGDAINLAWKLAAVVHGRADPQLLASYAEERVPFARRLVATTDRAFELISSKGRLATAIRRDVVPSLLPAFLHFESARRLMFRIVSQIEIAYRDSALSAGRAGGVHGGDRLPWVRGSSTTSRRCASSPGRSTSTASRRKTSAMRAKSSACRCTRSRGAMPHTTRASRKLPRTSCAPTVTSGSRRAIRTSSPAYWDTRRIRP